MNLVLYALNTETPTGIGVTLLFMVAAIFFLTLAWARRTPRKRWPNLATGVTEIFRAPLKIGLSLLTFALLFGGLNVYQWRQLQQISMGPGHTVIEGFVADASVRGHAGSGSSVNYIRETFSVSGREISYRSDEKGPYPLLMQSKGVLKNGSAVRITFLGDVIVRVETNSP